MTSDYFDLDDILASAEKVPTKFNLTVPGIGHLDNQPGQPIMQNTKVDLPLWLASVLAVTTINEDEAFIDLLTPDYLSNTVKNAIKSDAVSIDLHSILPNYYKVAEKWCTMFNDEELAEIIKKLCKDRSFEINNYASNTTKQISNNFILSLDEFEKKLYKKTVESNRNLRDWLNE